MLSGSPVPDDMLVNAGVGALSGPYQELITNLAFQGALTFEQFKARVREFYSRKKHDGAFAKGSGTEKALMAANDRGKKDSSSEIICYTCRGFGHKSVECPTNKVPSSSNSKPSGGKKSKPKKGISWKKPLKSILKEPSKPTRETSDESLSNKGHGAFTAAETAVSSRDLSAVDVGTFVVDTGATSHMTSQVSLLDDVVLYKGTVTVAGGRIVSSTGKGNMRVTAVDINGDGVLINAT